MGTHALILAGGLGTRLRPLTFAIPKPLVPVGETPIIELIIRHLKKHGIRQFHVSTNYKSEILKLFCGDGSKWGVRIGYIDEEKPLGTAGPIGLVDLPEGEDLLCMNGDILTDFNFRKMLAFHRKHKADFTVGTVQHERQSRFGEIESDEKTHRIRNVREKPMYTATISAGIYIVNTRIRGVFIPAGRHLDMPDLMMKLVKSRKRVLDYPIREHWNAIEKLSDYEKLYDEE
ncbi:MAG: sugar phosphate nucleotidyltransferase [Candidatus Hydrogenedentota bacterium]